MPFQWGTEGGSGWGGYINGADSWPAGMPFCGLRKAASCCASIAAVARLNIGR